MRLPPARLILSTILAVLTLGGCDAAGGAVSRLPAPVTPSPAALVAESPDPTPPPPPAFPASGTHLLDPVTETPLQALPGLPAEFPGGGANFGVAVLVPGQATVYTYKGDDAFHMASIIKVVVMMATMDRAQEEQRRLTATELDLVEPMIVWSDNDAADWLWWDLGGGPALETYLQKIGVTGIVPDAVGYWGDSLATPKAISLLLAKLLWGDVLNAENRALALELMGNVDPEQRWGVVGPLPGSGDPDWHVGVKDGWYPDEDGWEVNSAGFVAPATGTRGYTIAVLSSEQETFEDGVAQIEQIAGWVHQALLTGGALG